MIKSAEHTGRSQKSCPRSAWRKQDSSDCRLKLLNGKAQRQNHCLHRSAAGTGSKRQKQEHETFQWGNQETIFSHKGGRKTESVAQRGGGASILRDIPDSTGHSPEQPSLVDPALSGRLDSVTSRGPFLAILLWFCMLNLFVSFFFDAENKKKTTSGS